MRDETAVRVFVLDYLRHGPCRTRRPTPPCLVAVRLHSRGDYEEAFLPWAYRARSAMG